MSELVSMLSNGEHPLEVSLRPETTPAALQNCIAKGYVHLKFTGTRGGTSLYVPLDSALCDLESADFESRQGSIKLVGTLVLDYIPVRCHATVSLATMAGSGHLEVLPA
jgi:hypothetical protein